MDEPITVESVCSVPQVNFGAKPPLNIVTVSGRPFHRLNTLSHGDLRAPLGRREARPFGFLDRRGPSLERATGIEPEFSA